MQARCGTGRGARGRGDQARAFIGQQPPLIGRHGQLEFGFVVPLTEAERARVEARRLLLLGPSDVTDKVIGGAARRGRGVARRRHRRVRHIYQPSRGYDRVAGGELGAFR